MIPIKEKYEAAKRKLKRATTLHERTSALKRLTEIKQQLNQEHAEMR